MKLIPLLFNLYYVKVSKEKALGRRFNFLQLLAASIVYSRKIFVYAPLTNSYGDDGIGKEGRARKKTGLA
ncbi:hypothetical protein BK049_12495 [Bacillus xiamenensis]|uniref:Uncharacterized protein n=1 Tax=Bacillus xiamenensis TaxID=1178537 RepID=A0AAC9NCB1_9BACI|nr:MULTISPECIES: hypothetical protein [Bacillus]AOZ89437.1 hypothetical protein BK049_12495 [Bacillus xiamenensis]EKF34494.1 hypothetical protein BA1_14931 [Bacillus xiamenensis]QGX64827.1 hypothetical protein GPA07_04930 [Bacillus sp. ms-22]